MKVDTVLVFNFGGQYCHLIARRIRDSGVYSEIVDNDISVDGLKKLEKKFNVKGIVLSGGPESIYNKEAPKINKEILNYGLPILGICYGHQLLASYLNGKVVSAKKQEYGSSYVSIINPVGVLDGLSKRESVWMSHGDTVLSLPKRLEVLAETDNCPVAAFRDKDRRIYGIQWHAEVVHTKNGERVLNNFVFDVCGCKKNWNAENLVNKYIEEIESLSRGERAIIAMSGGVDSSTAAVLASKALGRKLTAVFVDNGLMREGEPKKIQSMADSLGVNLIIADASKQFLKELIGVVEPEQKRKIIGREFIRTFEKVARNINAKYLIQGTIYPDRIESGKSKKASVIKTHHNVGGLPTDIEFDGIIEPLKDLYKDEVKRLAVQLGIPRAMVYRQPFPGPGLAVRIVGEITEEKLNILRRSDSIVTGEIERLGLEKSLWQYFAVLTDTKSTGVRGDSRAYGYVLAIRAVESKDAMTAGFAKIPYEALEEISTKITGEIPQVVRVVYDITNKPPSTIEWE